MSKSEKIISQANNIGMEKLHKLFSVSKYSLFTNNDIATKYTEYTTEELINKLENNDDNYHFRVHNQTQYTFYSDVDGIEISFDEYINKLINFLKTYYDISITNEDISYTSNKGKKGSYHLAIPKLNASTEKLKEIHTNFKNICFDRNNRCIDASIFSEHWFRYPNQSKEGDKTQRHLIIKGEMIDFIAEYIKEDSLNINDKTMIRPLKTEPIINEVIRTNKPICSDNHNSSNANYINEVNIALHYLPDKYYDDYSEWIRIGLMLKSDDQINESQQFNIFNEFSKKSSKHDSVNIQKQFQNIKPDGRLHINSLFYEARKYGYEKPHDAYQKLTNGQYGHAQLFYDYHSEDIVISNNVGYVYDEKTCLWIQKDYSQITNMIPSFIQKKVRQELINNNKIIPANEEDQKKQIQKNDELNKLLKQTTTTSHIKNVFDQTKTLFYNHDFIKQLDTNQELIPIKNNKVVDLKTCTTRPRTKYDNFTFECPVDLLDDEHKLEHAHEFFQQIMNNNEDNLTFFQKCLGYICSGWTTQRKLFICWGKGANGKTTVCELLSLIFGKFYKTLMKSTFITNKNNKSNDPSEISLINAHIGVFSETESGEKLNGGVLKAITGNDQRTVRPLYSNNTIEFKLILKPILLTNNKPELDTNDQAILDRLIYIPFNARFTDKPKQGEFKKDCDKIDKLKTEYLNEVFTFIVRGSKMFIESGHLEPPQDIQDATNEYINEFDTVSKFIEDKCILNEKEKIKSSTMYEHYKKYCIETGQSPKDNKDFVKIMKEKFTYVKLVGIYHYRGINFLQAEEEE